MVALISLLNLCNKSLTTSCLSPSTYPSSWKSASYVTYLEVCDEKTLSQYNQQSDNKNRFSTDSRSPEQSQSPKFCPDKKKFNMGFKFAKKYKKTISKRIMLAYSPLSNFTTARYDIHWQRSPVTDYFHQNIFPHRGNILNIAAKLVKKKTWRWRLTKIGPSIFNLTIKI